MQKFESVDDYIASFDQSSQPILNTLRDTIINRAPLATESISYGMPAYKMNKKPLVYFAAYRNHIGLYATPSGHEAFSEELAKYKQGKGSVQFPITEPLPYDLIERIIDFRVQEVTQSSAK